MKSAPVIELSSAERRTLSAWSRGRRTPARLVLRAGDDDAPSNLEIAEEFECDRDTVWLWRNRFLAQGVAGLQDAPRSGRPRSFSPR